MTFPEGTGPYGLVKKKSSRPSGGQPINPSNYPPQYTRPLPPGAKGAWATGNFDDFGEGHAKGSVPSHASLPRFQKHSHGSELNASSRIMSQALSGAGVGSSRHSRTSITESKATHSSFKPRSREPVPVNIRGRANSKGKSRGVLSPTRNNGPIDLTLDDSQDMDHEVIVDRQSGVRISDTPVQKAAGDDTEDPLLLATKGKPSNITQGRNSDASPDDPNSEHTYVIRRAYVSADNTGVRALPYDIETKESSARVKVNHQQISFEVEKPYPVNLRIEPANIEYIAFPPNPEIIIVLKPKTGFLRGQSCVEIMQQFQYWSSPVYSKASKPTSMAPDVIIFDLKSDGPGFSLTPWFTYFPELVCRNLERPDKFQEAQRLCRLLRNKWSKCLPPPMKSPTLPQPTTDARTDLLNPRSKNNVRIPKAVFSRCLAPSQGLRNRPRSPEPSGNQPRSALPFEEFSESPCEEQSEDRVKVQEASTSSLEHRLKPTQLPERKSDPHTFYGSKDPTRPITRSRDKGKGSTVNPTQSEIIPDETVSSDANRKRPGAGTIDHRSIMDAGSDSDIVLVWPYENEKTTHSVAITRGDLKRLEDGEFLNDTLIEFGLKWELNEIQKKHSKLGDSIHLFNSFFFQKLNRKSKKKGTTVVEDSKLAYDGVHKWTKGHDLFKKDYVVIPINEHMHWYFMIVANPSKILNLDPQQPKTPTIPNTRSRNSNAQTEAGRATKAHSTTPATPEPDESTLKDSHFFTSAPKKEGLAAPENTEISVDRSTTALGEMSLDQEPDPEVVQKEPTIADDDTTAPCVLMLDSLATTSHRPHAKTILRYLVNEANAKLQSDLTHAVIDQVAIDKVDVPEQPNYCDCGLYLIHAFKIFFDNPDDMMTWIRTHRTRKKKLQDPDWINEVRERWNAEAAEVARQTLKDIVYSCLRLYAEHIKQKKERDRELKEEKKGKVTTVITEADEIQDTTQPTEVPTGIVSRRRSEFETLNAKQDPSPTTNRSTWSTKVSATSPVDQDDGVQCLNESDIPGFRYSFNVQKIAPTSTYAHKKPLPVILTEGEDPDEFEMSPETSRSTKRRRLPVDDEEDCEDSRVSSFSQVAKYTREEQNGPSDMDIDLVSSFPPGKEITTPPSDSSDGPQTPFHQFQPSAAAVQEPLPPDVDGDPIEDNDRDVSRDVSSGTPADIDMILADSDSSKLDERQKNPVRPTTSNTPSSNPPSSSLTPLSEASHSADPDRHGKRPRTIPSPSPTNMNSGTKVRRLPGVDYDEAHAMDQQTPHNKRLRPNGFASLAEANSGSGLKNSPIQLD